MRLDVVGFALLAVGVFAFLMKPRWLPTLTVFMVPFSATAVLSVDRVKLSLLGSTFFGLLWVIHVLGRAAISGTTHVAGPLVRPYLLLALFVAATAFSIIMPIYIDGRMSFVVISLLDFGTQYPVRFSMWHVVHLGFVVYGAVLAGLLAHRCLEPGRLSHLVRTYLAAGLATAVVALGEWLAFQLGTSWPLIVLNNSASGAITGFRQIDDLGLVRLSSVAEEPSVLAQQLVAVLPFAVLAVLTRFPVLGRKLDVTALVAITLVLLLSTSATAYLGLLAVFAGAAFVVLRLGVARARLGALLLILSLPPALAYATSDTVREFVLSFLVNKPTSGSGIERISSVILGWGYFRSYPLFGLGFGVIPVFDLLVKLLVGVGVVGTICFVVFVSHVLHRLQQPLRSLAVDDLGFERAMAGGCFVGLCAILVVSETSGFMHQLGTFWVNVGLGIGLGAFFLARRAAARAPQ